MHDKFEQLKKIEFDITDFYTVSFDISSITFQGTPSKEKQAKYESLGFVFSNNGHNVGKSDNHPNVRIVLL